MLLLFLGVQLLLVGAFFYQTTTAAASRSCILTSDICKTSISKQDHVLKFQVGVKVGGHDLTQYT